MNNQNLSPYIWINIKHRAKNRKINFAKINDKEISYQALLKKIEKLTTFFEIHRIQKVLIISKDNQSISEIALSALLNGIVFCIVDDDIKQPRFDAIERCFEPDYIFIDSDSPVNTHTTYSFVVKNSNKSMLSSLFSKKEINTNYPNLLDSLDFRAPNIHHKEHCAYVIFTSGTTAEPKGVQISHLALLSHLSTLSNVYGYSENSHIFNSLKVSHADGLVQGPLLAAFTGGTWSSMGKFEITRIESYFDYIVANDITHYITVPVVLALIFKYAADDEVFSSDRFNCVISTGGHLPAQLWQDFELKYNVIISNLYGLSETCTGGVFSGLDKVENRYGTIGFPVDMEFSIGNPEENEKLTEGILWLKGDNIMDGYLNK